MFRTNAILWGLIFFSNCSFSQTYSFTYKCLYNSLSDIQISNSAKPDDSLFQSVKGILVSDVQILYEIVTDGHFMIVKGKIDPSPSRQLVINSSHDEAIIDIWNKLIYFSEDQVIKKIKIYSLVSDTIYGDCTTKLIQSKGPEFKVELCKKIPSAISPPILFTGADYGVQSISAPGLKVELLSFKKINRDERLQDCEKYFKGKKITNSEYDFFSQ